MNATLRTLRSAAWLGWQIESNWTQPWIFAIYVLLKPVAGSLALVFMFYAARAATNNAVPLEFLPFLYIGNAAYSLVGAVMFGMSYTVISDREHHRMMKYICISPARLLPYFIGRGAAKGFQALVGSLLNLGIGWLCFADLRNALAAQPTDWLGLVAVIGLGAVMLTALGLILTGVLLNMARHGMFLSDGLAGIMYLLCGVVFPIGILPSWVQPISLALPPTYWLEACRRCLLPRNTSVLNSPLASWSDGELVAVLAGSVVVLSAFAVRFFEWNRVRAWRRGRFEETTGI